MDYKLCIDNYRVFEFYNTHPYLNFEDVNLFLIDIFEKMFEKTNNDINKSDILENIVQTINSLHKNFDNNVIHKLIEFKKEYVEDLKINLNIHTSDKLTPIINQFNQIIQDKIQIMFNDKVSIMETKLQKIIDSNKLNMDNQTNLNENVSNLIKKMENSSSKGSISENLLYNVLVNLFSNGEIIYTNQETHHGDILLKRKSKYDILFENKDYNYNVPKKEIEKFIEDINLNNCCGIMLSQKSGISLKDNFEIEIYKGKVVLYLHNVNYSMDIIKTAINIIDHLQGEINTDTENTIQIDKHILDSINMEYKNYAIQKIEHIESIKTMSGKLIKQAEELKHPSIESLINKYYNNSINKEFTCICGKIWTNKRSLGSHQKTCEKFKNKSILTS
jgi:hypothetical protein